MSDSSLPPTSSDVLVPGTPGLVLRTHRLTVPLDHAAPTGATIEIFAREVARPGGEHLPYLLYLEGGPGSGAPRPTARSLSPGWLGDALRDHRVLLLDQRGTGLSTPIGTDLPGTAAEQAPYLACFRADSIVRDSELLRSHLGVERWTVLGQSFGGFCTLAYLSTAAEVLEAAIITGGLPVVDTPLDDVYDETYARMGARSRAFHERYPGDRDLLRDLVPRLDADPIDLGGGDLLTGRRLRQLGHLLGLTDGAERLHHLLELPVTSTAFRHDAAAAVPYARNPLYAVLQEACWADGGVTGWAAERTLPASYRDDPALLLGEHVFAWMWEDYAGLRPLRQVAEALAQHPWPRLYDEDALASADVPCVAIVYGDDPFVPATGSLPTARLLPRLDLVVRDDLEHDALRTEPGLLGQLLGRLPRR